MSSLTKLHKLSANLLKTKSQKPRPLPCCGALLDVDAPICKKPVCSDLQRDLNTWGNSRKDYLLPLEPIRNSSQLRRSVSDRCSGVGGHFDYLF